MQQKTGLMKTDRPERYAKQLVSHRAARGSVSDGEDEARAPVGTTVGHRLWWHRPGGHPACSHPVCSPRRSTTKLEAARRFSATDAFFPTMARSTRCDLADGGVNFSVGAVGRVGTQSPRSLLYTEGRSQLDEMVTPTYDLESTPASRL